MSESGYYAPGTEHDPRAPWNQDEPVECERCNGSGRVPLHWDAHPRADEDPEKHASVPCPACEGEGFVMPEEPEAEWEPPEERG